MAHAIAATEVSSFGTLPDGSPVHLYTVRRGQSEVAFTDYGARIVSLIVPDAHGGSSGVVQGCDTLDPYLTDKAYQGAAIGRFGNRIAGGRFALDGQTFQIPLNDGPNALHGGPEGFDRRLWTGAAIDHGVEFTLLSPAGDQGFPGALSVTIRYTFLDDTLRIDYTATTDAPTIVNLTNHAYFNLAGDSSGSVLDHHITIPAAHFTPVNETLIPTGQLAPVAGTVFDLRQPALIGQNIDADDHQLKLAGGWDHNWVLGNEPGMKLAAVLHHPATGRTLTVRTMEPGIQFYSGNFLDGTTPNRSGGSYKKRDGLCLETQHFPDSPNQPAFPSTILRPGETLRSTTTYAFTTESR
jgi:aldose 1-epimerase